MSEKDLDELELKAGGIELLDLVVGVWGAGSEGGHAGGGGGQAEEVVEIMRDLFRPRDTRISTSGAEM